MAGYHGYSMSNNAVEAYKQGEKPLSKWTKKIILEEVSKLGYSFPLLKSVSLDTLKRKLLCYSSYHHTSKYFNTTNFYELNIFVLDNLTDVDITVWLNEEKENKKKVPTKTKSEKWICSYLQWSDSRRHPVAKRIESIGEIRGNWFYTKNGKKKSLNANGFEKIKKLEGEN